MRLVEPDPKASNLFDRYVPDEPRQKNKGGMSSCHVCGRKVLLKNLTDHHRRIHPE